MHHAAGRNFFSLSDFSIILSCALFNPVALWNVVGGTTRTNPRDKWLMPTAIARLYFLFACIFQKKQLAELTASSLLPPSLQECFNWFHLFNFQHFSDFATLLLQLPEQNRSPSVFLIPQDWFFVWKQSKLYEQKFFLCFLRSTLSVITYFTLELLDTEKKLRHNGNWILG